MEKLSEPGAIQAHIREIYSHNPFMTKLCPIDIEEIKCGKVTISFQTDPALHTNHRGILHGGLFLALIDSVTGVTGASIGAKVATASLSTNFIANARPGSRLTVKSHTVHRGRSSYVMEMKLIDENGKIIADSLATMWIVERFEEIPDEW